MERPVTPVAFGKYELLELIATGGMAEVFRARRSGDGGFEKHLVIKRIRPHLSSDADFVVMLIDEARIAVSLKHPNIVQIYDLGKIEGTYYIAMELIEGGDLKVVLHRGKRLPIPHALFVAIEVLKGLEYAHSKMGGTSEKPVPLNIVHRDISPPNILISYEGEVKLVDFGIAKASVRLMETSAGILKGKFEYMSPEQASGLALDNRTDLYSTATVLYEMLTGVSPFEGLTDLAVLEKVRKSRPPAPSKHNPDIPPKLDAILLKALSRDQEDRYQKAQDFRAELVAFVYASGFVSNASRLANHMRGLFAEEVRMGRVARVESAVPGRTPSALEKPAPAEANRPASPPPARNPNTQVGRLEGDDEDLPTIAERLPSNARAAKPRLDIAKDAGGAKPPASAPASAVSRTGVLRPPVVPPLIPADTADFPPETSSTLSDFSPLGQFTPLPPAQGPARASAPSAARDVFSFFEAPPAATTAPGMAMPPEDDGPTTIRDTKAEERSAAARVHPLQAAPAPAPAPAPAVVASPVVNRAFVTVPVLPPTEDELDLEGEGDVELTGSAPGWGSQARHHIPSYPPNQSGNTGMPQQPWSQPSTSASPQDPGSAYPGRSHRAAGDPSGGAQAAGLSAAAAQAQSAAGVPRADQSWQDSAARNGFPSNLRPFGDVAPTNVITGYEPFPARAADNAPAFRPSVEVTPTRIGEVSPYQDPVSQERESRRSRVIERLTYFFLGLIPGLMLASWFSMADRRTPPVAPPPELSAPTLVIQAPDGWKVTLDSVDLEGVFPLRIPLVAEKEHIVLMTSPDSVQLEKTLRMKRGESLEWTLQMPGTASQERAPVPDSPQQE